MWPTDDICENDEDSYEYHSFVIDEKDDFVKSTPPFRHSYFHDLDLYKNSDSTFMSLINETYPSINDSLGSFNINNRIDSETVDRTKYSNDPSLTETENETYEILLKLLSVNKSMQERLLVVFTNIQQSLKKIRAQQVIYFCLK